MYNRYIPQSDGSFKRSRIPEPSPEKAPIPPTNDQAESPPIGSDEAYIPPIKKSSPPSNRNMASRSNMSAYHEAGSISHFFKGLLPSDLDTEDLIVILLLLLMSGSRSNDQNAALLTLGIYLFM